jgi:CHAD domain-containing protein
LKLDKPVTKRVVIYDTFDWRLFKRSTSLHGSASKLSLRSLENNETRLSIITSAKPKFAWDLPEGVLREWLEPVIKMRALLALTAFQKRSTRYHILNKDEKTVIRLLYSEFIFANGSDKGPSESQIELQPIRGYPKYERQLLKLLQKAGAVAVRGDEVTPKALKAAGKQAGSYTNKLTCQLKPQQRADEAAKIILRQMLEVIRANEAGIKADIDTEYLHDFRIAIRRTRSLLSQVKGIFPVEETERFKKDFRTLGKLSNELRDLDVYLLSEEKYRSALPEEMREDIGPLFNYLRERRVAALKKVVKGLKSKTYGDVTRDWETFLGQPSAKKKEAPNAAVPVIDIARRRIYKRYRRVLNDGTYILDHTRDELLHDLRLECKKLRYLMEFFACLFPRKKVSRLINQLKRLQDNLGEFTDLSVQQEYLMHIAEELPVEERQARRALVATGYLVETMARKQHLVKNEFAGTFTKFASSQNEKLFRELFAKSEKQSKKKSKQEGRKKGKR